MKLTIGTRGSALALWQAGHVASRISEAIPGIVIDTQIIKTQGDKILDAPLSKIGGKGLFTKEIEDALLEGSVDLAVHSMKDVPTELPEGLHIKAILEREDPRDVFISKDGRHLKQLTRGSLVGTSSLRRRAFLLSKYPGLDVVSIRGNVDTRIKKIVTENLDGVMLAAAGVIRMGFSQKITEFLPSDFMIPAIGQGAIGIETRIDDDSTNRIIRQLNHEATELCVNVERAFLSRMGGGCQVPMAAHCEWENGVVSVEAAVAHPDGAPILRQTYHGSDTSAQTGIKLADSLIGLGADEILKEVLGSSWEPGCLN